MKNGVGLMLHACLERGRNVREGAQDTGVCGFTNRLSRLNLLFLAHSYSISSPLSYWAGSEFNLHPSLNGPTSRPVSRTAAKEARNQNTVVI